MRVMAVQIFLLNVTCSICARMWKPAARGAISPVTHLFRELNLAIKAAPTGLLFCLPRTIKYVVVKGGHAAMSYFYWGLSEKMTS